nr:zinc finger, CCHC-type [Tanacetum cinerariifolium]
MLHMKDDETIDTFTTKLTTLVNKSASLGHTIEDGTLVRKLLNAVPDRYMQIVTSIEKYSDLSEMTFEEAIGRLKTYKERIKYKRGKQVDNQESLLFTRHEDQGQQFRKHGHGGFNQSRGQENNFKKISDSNSNKFTHDKSKVLCFKCQEYGHFANKCPSNKEEQSNFIEEDLEPTLLMATTKEAQEWFINQELKEIPFNFDLTISNIERVGSESLDGGVTKSMNQPGIKEDTYTTRTLIERQSVGTITNQKHDQSGFMINHNYE